MHIGRFHYDHDIPDGQGGEPTLDNCVVLCIPCHSEKTRKIDVPGIAKTKRIRDKHLGISSPRQKIQGRGFYRAEPQRTASRPVEKLLAWMDRAEKAEAQVERMTAALQSARHALDNSLNLNSREVAYRAINDALTSTDDRKEPPDYEAVHYGKRP